MEIKKYGVIISFDSQITTKFTGIEMWKNLFFDNQLLIGLTENEIKKIFVVTHTFCHYFATILSLRNDKTAAKS